MCVVACGIHRKVGLADGVIYRDAKYGLWSGTFIDSTGHEAEEACEIQARRVAHKAGQRLPADGKVVEVRFVEVER